MVDKHKLAFPILRDGGNELAQQFGLRFELPEDLQKVYLQFEIDLPKANGEPSWTLPMPARYIFDGSGTIRYARVHPDYTQRPEPAETVAALRNLT